MRAQAGMGRTPQRSPWCVRQSRASIAHVPAQQAGFNLRARRSHPAKVTETTPSYKRNHQARGKLTPSRSKSSSKDREIHSRVGVYERVEVDTLVRRADGRRRSTRPSEPTACNGPYLDSPEELREPLARNGEATSRPRSSSWPRPRRQDKYRPGRREGWRRGRVDAAPRPPTALPSQTRRSLAKMPLLFAPTDPKRELCGSCQAVQVARHELRAIVILKAKRATSLHLLEARWSSCARGAKHSLTSGRGEHV